jgi:NAD(P)-dependent dehydrogenase (short-subunit alcohol dehydrogenase family)
MGPTEILSRPGRKTMPSSTPKIALVTGANKGIGLETSRQLAKLGFIVLMAARDESRGKEAAAQVAKEGGQEQFLKLDTANAADRAAAAGWITEKYGRLDVLINNAAVNLDREFKTTTVSEDILRKTFDTNFFAVIALTQKLLPLLAKSEAGRIVNLSSNLGSLTQHSDPRSQIYNVKLPAYDFSKTALNAFTVHLAHELKDTPIKVNSAHPGWVKTDMGGAGAPTQLIDGAKTSVQLATLPANGPTGGFFHLGERLPW